MELYYEIALCEKNVHKCKHLIWFQVDFKDGAANTLQTLASNFCWFQDKGLGLVFLGLLADQCQTYNANVVFN